MAPRDTESSDWQVNYPEVKMRSAHLFRSREWTDCTFRFEIGPGKAAQSLEAHKLILAMASPVFAAMFYGNFGDKEGSILITDIEEKTFSSMLKYIYTDEIDIKNFQEAMDLYYAAKKYFLPHLQQETINAMCRRLNASNVCRVFEFSRFHDEPQLDQECERIITKQTLDVFFGNSFLEAKRETVKEIISFESLNIASELDIFNALVRYADHRLRDAVCGIDTVKTMPQLRVKLTRIDAPRNSGTSDRSVSKNGTQTSAVVPRKKTANNVENQSNLDLTSMDSSDRRTCRLGGWSYNFLSDVSRNKIEALRLLSNTCHDKIEAHRILQTLLSLYDSESPAQETAARDSEADTPEGPPVEATSYRLAHETAANDREVDSSKADYVRRLMRPCVQQIRFLTLAPRQFAECRRLPTLLTDPEIVSLSLNIASKETAVRMPEGFSKSFLPRNQHRGNKPATIRFTVNNFVRVKKYTTDTFIACEIPWQVTVHLLTKRKNNSQEKLNYLRVFIDCLERREGEWSCQTHFTIKTVYSVDDHGRRFDLPLQSHVFTFSNKNTRATNTYVRVYSFPQPDEGSVPFEPVDINVTFEVRVGPAQLITSDGQNNSDSENGSGTNGGGRNGSYRNTRN